MPHFDPDLRQREAAYLARHGLYDPAEEHDACGVGFVATLNGKPRREVVQAAIEALPTARPATAPASTCRSPRTSSTNTSCALATGPTKGASASA
jgi:hypothetical protein